VILGESLAMAQGPKSSPAAKKTPASAAAVTSVELTGNTAPPGTVAVLPVYFKPAGGITARRIQFTVTFPSAHLKYERLDRGEAAKKAGAELTANAESRKDKTGAVTSLTIIADLPATEQAAGIGAGVVGSIVLRVGDDAPHGSISLQTRAEVVNASTGQPLTGVRSPSTQLKVPWLDAPPSVNCFFFSH
jgi:hypothetical protein